VHLLTFAVDKDNLGATPSLRNFLWPSNLLRNVASQLVLTEWTLVMDADLMPNVHAAVFDRHLVHAVAYVPDWLAQEKVRNRAHNPNPKLGVALVLTWVHLWPPEVCFIIRVFQCV